MWPFSKKKNKRSSDVQLIECKIKPEEMPRASIPMCNCMDAQYNDQPWQELHLHTEEQDTACGAWKKLLKIVDEAAKDKREEFIPSAELSGEEWSQVVTLPSTISKLKPVKHLSLYGSGIVRIPPEIGEMTNLTKFTPYTSYRLHWFPYEITKCKKLKESTVSTRALYGNYKYHAPFPALPNLSTTVVPSKCSICGGGFKESGPLQYWISLPVATGVLPLLVHACSNECLDSLPKIELDGYIPGPHKGGK